MAFLFKSSSKKKKDAEPSPPSSPSSSSASASSSSSSHSTASSSSSSSSSSSTSASSSSSSPTSALASTSVPVTPPVSTHGKKPAKSPKAKKVDPNRRLEAEYIIGKELGRGASSIVYEAVHLKTKQAVAVKRINKSLIKPEVLKKLYIEVEVMRKLQHENIVQLLDCFETPTYVDLVVELVRGGELFDKIVARGYYSEADAAVIVTQILRAVNYMHQNKVCHRDLKPENLLCSEDEELYIRIADFGLSKIIDQGEKMLTVCGTPDYVAPEILRCKPYTSAVDMWAIGVITYTLLCGFTPFYGNNHKELFHRISTLSFDFPEPEWTQISDDAKSFISQLLVLKPSQRLTAADSLEHPWLTKYGDATKSLPSLATAQRKLRRWRQRCDRYSSDIDTTGSGLGASGGATAAPSSSSTTGTTAAASAATTAVTRGTSTTSDPDGDSSRDLWAGGLPTDSDDGDS
ncbi:myosin light chain kinase [Pelomyxa schiedti]|nr:myosin light chain kinase [Pelomyxa schiedti]